MAAFRLYDQNQDGKVDLDELKHMLTRLHGPSCELELDAAATMKQADIDGDGSLSL